MWKDYLSLTFALTFVGKIIFTTFPLPFQLALLKNKIIEPCIFQDHSRLKKLKNFAKPLSLSNIAPQLFSRMFKVNCCPISMPQIITSTLFQTPQKPTLFSCFVNSFAIDTRCGNKRSINTSGIKINQLIELIFLATKPSPDPLPHRCTCVSLKRRSETKLLRNNFHAEGRGVAWLFCRWWRESVRCKFQRT